MKLPYEIHVTVKAPVDIEKFKTLCGKIKVKPIVLDLIKNNETAMIDVMTSSKMEGTFTQAVIHSGRIALKLMVNDFKVIREKIETVPWHPTVPTIENGLRLMKNHYFESHIQIITSAERKDELNLIAEQVNAHLSRNYFKKVSDKEFIIMLTYRKHTGTIEEFKLDIEMIKFMLEAKKFEFQKVEIEYALHDTKLSHDKVWIG